MSCISGRPAWPPGLMGPTTGFAGRCLSEQGFLRKRSRTQAEAGSCPWSEGMPYLLGPALPEQVPQTSPPRIRAEQSREPLWRPLCSILTHGPCLCPSLRCGFLLGTEHGRWPTAGWSSWGDLTVCYHKTASRTSLAGAVASRPEGDTFLSQWPPPPTPIPEPRAG